MLLHPHAVQSQTSSDKSILHPTRTYGEHELVRFRTIRNRSLPLSVDLSAYAPFALQADSIFDNRSICTQLYLPAIRKAFLDQLPDRAFVSDSILSKLTFQEKLPKAYRLYTSRNRRSDKLKRIRYALKKGIPILVGFSKKAPLEPLYGQAIWDGQGQDANQVMLLIGYDQKLSSFKLLNTHGEKWGESGSILMTYQDFFAKAKELICLENPNLSNPKKAEKPPTIPIQFSMAIAQADAHQVLQKLTPTWDPSLKTYQVKNFLINAQEDQLQLKLHIPKGRCAYLFMVHSNGLSTPAWKMDYPSRDTVVTLPPSSYYRLPDPGDEYYVLVVSHQPLPHWRRYVEYVEFNQQEISIPEKVRKAFARYLVDRDDIKYSPDQMKVVGKSNKRNQIAVPLILQLSVGPNDRRQ